MKLKDLQIGMDVLVFAEMLVDEDSAMVVAAEDGVVQEVVKVVGVTDVTEVV